MKYLYTILLAVIPFNAISAPICTFDIAHIVADSRGPSVIATCSETTKAYYFGTYCPQISRTTGWHTFTLQKGKKIQYFIPSEIFNRPGRCTIRLSVKDSKNKVVPQPNTRWTHLQVSK